MAQAKGPEIPPTERISASFKQLSAASTEVNSAANDLNKTISALNDALESLKLGVSAWHKIASNEDEDGNYWSRSIGYTMIGREWCIAFREASGNQHSDYHSETVYAYDQAPRWIVIESLGKVPELFETLLERVKDTTKKLMARADQTKELVAAVNAAVAEIAPPKGKK